jgi:hypothetical protein
MLNLTLDRVTLGDLAVEGEAFVDDDVDISADRSFFATTLLNAVNDLLYGGFRAAEEAASWIFQSDPDDFKSFVYYWDNLFDQIDADHAIRALRKKFDERRNNAGQNPGDGRRRRHSMYRDHDRVGGLDEDGSGLDWLERLLFGTPDQEHSRSLERNGVRRKKKKVIRKRNSRKGG